ncbi:MAG: universal stress protein [Nitriliruptoraceae bacterium]
MDMHRILVGVDTSDASILALKQAAEEARLRDAVLEVVYVFSPPEQVTAFPVPPEKGKDTRKEIEEVRAQYADKLGAWLDEVDVDLTGLRVEWSVLADRRPSRALVERSKDADMVVVGHRGRGGFRGLRLGSVSEQVTRHAKAPVLVIRESTKQ